MTRFIQHTDEVTDAWLSEVLEHAVQIVERQPNAAFNSSIVHLTIHSEGDHLPERLIAKLNAHGDGEFEIRFYDRLDSQSEPLDIVPGTPAFGYDPITGQSYLVQEDLSATHRPPIDRETLLSGRGVPDELHLMQVTEAIARFHAYWWEHVRQGDFPVRPWYGNQTEFDAHITRREREWSTFTAQGQDVPAEISTFYNMLLSRLPELWGRYLEPRISPKRGLTLSHGDSYFTQFLCPIQPLPEGRAYLVDYQEASVNFAPFDLVFMFATFWTPDQRNANQREEGLLRHYHHVLCENGVSNYPWEMLMEDYRLMLALIVFFPIFDAVTGASQTYWQTKMQCLIGNFHDLRCWELFDA